MTISKRNEVGIEGFTIEDSDPFANPEAIVYRHGDVDRKQLGGGHDFGAIVVQVGVDETWDIVTVDLQQTGDMAALDRALDTLHAVRDELARLYGKRPRRLGRCLDIDENGRCKSTLGHEGSHRFPTAEEVAVDVAVLSAVKASA